jgi:hypothetical protein
MAQGSETRAGRAIEADHSKRVCPLARAPPPRRPHLDRHHIVEVHEIAPAPTSKPVTAWMSRWRFLGRVGTLWTDAFDQGGVDPCRAGRYDRLAELMADRSSTKSRSSIICPRWSPPSATFDENRSNKENGAHPQTCFIERRWRLKGLQPR